MTRADIIEALARKPRVKSELAEEIVCRVFDAMAEALARGENIEIRGFGTFRIRVSAPPLPKVS